VEVISGRQIPSEHLNLISARTCTCTRITYTSSLRHRSGGSSALQGYNYVTPG